MESADQAFPLVKPQAIGFLHRISRIPIVGVLRHDSETWGKAQGDREEQNDGVFSQQSGAGSREVG